jgi:hypothetical protein
MPFFFHLFRIRQSLRVPMKRLYRQSDLPTVVLLYAVARQPATHQQAAVIHQVHVQTNHDL